MARTKRPLSEDPIGDKFDRCVKHIEPKLGKRAAQAICAKTMRKAYGEALTKAVQKAAAERRAGLRPARAKRGTARVRGPAKIGDVRRGDAFVVAGRPTIYVATSAATAKRIKGKYRTVVKVRGGKTLRLAPTTRVRIGGAVAKPVRTVATARAATGRAAVARVANPTRFESLRQRVVAASRRRGYALQDPSGRAIAAAIGRKKYGKAQFQAMALAGKKKSFARKRALGQPLVRRKVVALRPAAARPMRAVANPRGWWWDDSLGLLR